MLNSLKLSCKACNKEREETSTVKIDLDRLAIGKQRGKENTAPTSEHRKESELQEERRIKEEECRIKEEEKAQKDRKLKEEEDERKRREATAEAAMRRAADEEKARRLAEIEKEAQQALQAEQVRLAFAEECRIAEEQHRVELERQRKEEARIAHEAAKHAEQLEIVLKRAGCKEVNEKKRKAGIIFSSFAYPLHASVEIGDEGAVRTLLRSGADRGLVNSKKQSPLDLARKRNKKGSLDGIIALLSS